MVRSTRADAAANRERVIDEAARRFRAQGFDGIGIAALMRAAGMTHGGFYGQFASKDELKALACRRAVDRMLEDWREKAAASPDDPLDAVVDPYLSATHRDDPGTGCLMAALGPEAARQAAPVRRVVTECFEDVIAALADFSPDDAAPARRDRAIRLFALLVGAMVIARVVDEPALSDEVLSAARGADAADPASLTEL